MIDEVKNITDNVDIPLVFTSEHALRRSIRKKYSDLSEEQQEATFEQQKEWIGMSPKQMEDYIDQKYEDYKEKEQQDNPK